MDELASDRIDWCFGAMERSIQPVKFVTQVVLVVGFGALLAKLESRNPTGSVKDRIAAAMVDDVERVYAGALSR